MKHSKLIWLDHCDFFVFEYQKFFPMSVKFFDPKKYYSKDFFTNTYFSKKNSLTYIFDQNNLLNLKTK